MNEIAVKKALQEITSDQNMKVLNHVAMMLVDNWQKTSTVGANEWETVKNAIMREERKKALEIFLLEIEKIAHE